MSRHSDPAIERLSAELSADQLDFIRRFSCKLAGSRRMEDDLAQEAVTRVLDKLPTFLQTKRQDGMDPVPPALVKAWIGSVVQNVWREIRRQPGSKSPASPAVENVPQGESSTALDESKRHMRACLEVIRRRDPEAYEVLALVVRYGSARKAAESREVPNFWRRYRTAISLLRDVDSE